MCCGLYLKLLFNAGFSGLSSDMFFGGSVPQGHVLNVFGVRGSSLSVR